MAKEAKKPPETKDRPIFSLAVGGAMFAAIAYGIYLAANTDAAADEAVEKIKDATPDPEVEPETPEVKTEVPAEAAEPEVAEAPAEATKATESEVSEKHPSWDYENVEDESTEKTDNKEMVEEASLSEEQVKMAKDLGFTEEEFKQFVVVDEKTGTTFITDGKGNNLAKIVSLDSINEQGAVSWFRGTSEGRDAEYMLATLGDDKPFATVRAVQEATGIDLKGQTIYFTDHASDDGRVSTACTGDFKNNALIKVAYGSCEPVVETPAPCETPVERAPVPSKPEALPVDPTPVQEVPCNINVPRGGMRPDGLITTIEVKKDWNYDGDFNDAGEKLGYVDAQRYFRENPQDIPDGIVRGSDGRYYDQYQRDQWFERRAGYGEQYDRRHPRTRYYGVNEWGPREINPYHRGGYGYDRYHDFRHPHDYGYRPRGGYGYDPYHQPRGRGGVNFDYRGRNFGVRAGVRF